MVWEGEEEWLLLGQGRSQGKGPGRAWVSAGLGSWSGEVLGLEVQAEFGLRRGPAVWEVS